MLRWLVPRESLPSTRNHSIWVVVVANICLHATSLIWTLLWPSTSSNLLAIALGNQLFSLTEPIKLKSRMSKSLSTTSFWLLLCPPSLNLRLSPSNAKKTSLPSDAIPVPFFAVTSLKTLALSSWAPSMPDVLWVCGVLSAMSMLTTWASPTERYQSL